MPHDSNDVSSDREQATHMNSPEKTKIKPRKIWLAALLSFFFPPLGQVYCGRLRRAFCILLLGWFLELQGFWLCCHLPGEAISLIVFGMMSTILFFFLPFDAAILAYRSKNAPLKKYQRPWLYVLIYLMFAILELGVILIFEEVVAKSFVMPTRSMNFTILPGDRIWVDKLWYRFAPVKRGDIAAFHSNGPRSPIHAHRVIGLPGDVVEIRNEKLYLNGELQKEPYACLMGEKSGLPNAMLDFGPKTVPDGYFFQLGDNRRRSLDSRMTGFVPLQDIIGRVQVVYWSSGAEDPNADPDWSRKTNSPQKETPQRIRWERIGLRFDQ